MTTPNFGLGPKENWEEKNQDAPRDKAPDYTAESEFLDAAESARRINCSRRTLGFWTAKGWLPHIRVGKRFLRYRRTDLDAFMQKHQLNAKHEPRVRRRALRRIGRSTQT